jgi:hypothetical protein
LTQSILRPCAAPTSHRVEKVASPTSRRASAATHGGNIPSTLPRKAPRLILVGSLPQWGTGDERTVIFVPKTLYRAGSYCIAFRK